jgi:hypothetical protein
MAMGGWIECMNTVEKQAVEWMHIASIFSFTMPMMLFLLWKAVAGHDMISMEQGAKHNWTSGKSCLAGSSY